jgi:hypothetical protein
MKNKFLFALAILGIMTFAFCGSPKSSEAEETTPEVEAVEPVEEPATEEPAASDSTEVEEPAAEEAPAQ